MTITITPTISITPINYGLMYNWYAVDNVKQLTPAGWSIPTKDITDALKAYVGTSDGYHLRSTLWNRDNSTGFNAKGGGIRGNYGGFGELTSSLYLYTTYMLYTYSYYFSITQSMADSWYWLDNRASFGLSLRLVKNSTSLSNGQTNYMIGNDGKIYPAICLNGAEWMVSNLAETKYRDGTLIPEVTDNTIWVGLTTGALCAYNNNWSNV